LKEIPQSTAWYLSSITESRGKQALFLKQSPQKLKTLKEHALIESAVSSNRLEGVTIDRSRIGTVIFGKPLLRDRDEEEVKGYRDALNMIHIQNKSLKFSEKTIRKMHSLCRGETGDAGQYKTRDNDIIEKYPDGRERVRFRTVPVKKTKKAMQDLESLWKAGIKEKWIHPIILMAGADLDFLCIHPFRDGNGRVSRLILLLLCYHLGLEVGTYISLERLVELNKERYYETLEQSSQGWHERKHDPWPYINFILYIIKTAYGKFEERIGKLKNPRGSKTSLVISVIEKIQGDFRVADLREACPSVSIDMIRHILKKLKKEGRIICIGRGHTASWKKTDKWK
jgi:Fic family protein